VTTPTAASPFYYVVARGKVLANATFTGWVAPIFIHRMLQSLNLLPFWFDPRNADVAIPARRNGKGEIEIVEDNQMRAEGFRKTAQHFDEIDRALARAKVKQTIREKIDTRAKLTLQHFPTEGFLVLLGAGGSAPCAAMFDATGSQSNVVDQTLYWRWFRGRKEAAYYTGMINSEPLAARIAGFNPKGLFGGRHVHTLPWRVTPAFDDKDLRITGLARLSLELQQEVAVATDADPKLRNLSSSLVARRKRAWAVVEASGKYDQLNALALQILA
jgi:hypothetical protein